MFVSVQTLLDTTTDTLRIQVPAAEGEGDVTVLTLSLAALSADDKRRLRAVRPPDRLPSTEQANASTIEDSVDQALTDLRTIANSSGTLTGAQLSNAVRVIARVLIRFGRHYFRRLDATD